KASLVCLRLLRPLVPATRVKCSFDSVSWPSTPAGTPERKRTKAIGREYFMVDLEEDLERSRLRGVEARAPGGTKKPVLTADHRGWLDTRPTKRGKPTAEAIGGHWRRG